MVEVTKVEGQEGCIFLRGMEGSRFPIAVAHGEGRAEGRGEEGSVASSCCLRYVDNYGLPTTKFPANPNGSEGGATGFASADGRVFILMPHPERVVHSVSNSWHPMAWGEMSPSFSFFVNARKWVHEISSF